MELVRRPARRFTASVMRDRWADFGSTFVVFAVQCFMATTLGNPKLALLGSCTAAMLLAGCAAQHETQPQLTRQRFVPASDTSSRSSADWTALHRGPNDEPGVLMLIAHAGIGDSFPIQEEARPKLFDVTVVTGDDGHLVVEVLSEDGSQRVELRRDVAAWVTVTGHKYSLAYPSVTLARGSKPTTDKATIIVHRLP